MLKKITTLCLVILTLTGCMTHSELKKRSEINAKAGDYYESIGQPEAAKRSRKISQDNQDDSLTIEAILSDLLFWGNEK